MKREVIDDLKKIFVLALVTRIILVLACFSAPLLFPDNIQAEGSIINRLALSWDSGWYSAIAKSGYTGHDSEQRVAFFPLYPLLIRVFSYFFGFEIAALLVSNISFVFLIIVSYFFIREFFSRKIALRAVSFLIIFPTSFFLSVAYTESLYLLLVISTFYLSYRRKWFFAGLTGLLASLCRVNGVLLLIPLIYEYFKSNRKISLSILSLCLIPLGLLIFMLYLHLVLGDALLFAKAQFLWGRDLSVPGLNVLEYVFKASEFVAFYGWQFFSDLFFTIFLLILLKWHEKRVTGSLLTYSLLNSIFLLSTSSLMSMPRLLLSSFPIFIVLAMKTDNSRLRAGLKLLFFVLLYLYSLIFFTIFWLK
jgi:Gpi18-like mannosyltransferase